MTITFDGLLANAQRVLSSKSDASELYLDKQGAIQDDSAKRASIVELFYRTKTFLSYSASDYKKWHQYVITVSEIVEHEYKGSHASFLFMRLVAPLGIAVFSNRFNTSLCTLSVANTWITEHCMQDLCIVLMHEIKLIQQEISAELDKLPVSVQQYFINPDMSLKVQSIKDIFAKKPQTAIGEILFSKLRAQSKEQALYFPYEKALGISLFEFSTSKVSAFAHEGFIAELKTTYPDVADSFDEINAFCSLIKQFAHVYFLYKKHDAATQVCISFTNGYMPKIKDIRKESKMSTEDRRLLVINRLAKHPYAARMFDTVCINCQTNERLAKEAGFSDYKFDHKIDIEPFLKVSEEYFTSYRPFFLKHLSHLHGAYVFEKRSIYKTQAPREVSEELKVIMGFDAKFTDFLKEFKGPAVPDAIPSLESWNAYIANLKVFLSKAYKAPVLKVAAGEVRSLKQAIHLSMEPKGPEVTAGGASSKPNALESVLLEEEIESDEEIDEVAQIASAKAIFNASKHAKVVDLYEEIEKKPLDVVYADRVKNWFVSPEEVLAIEPYASMSEPLQNKMVLIHAFSLKVDHFLNSKFSQKRVWHNATFSRDDDLYVIPGYMIFEGKRLRGVFEFCKNHEFYHRVFKELSGDERFSDYLDAPDFDYGKAFPTLHAAAREQKKVFASCNGDFDVMIDAFGAAHFEDDGVSYILLNLT